MSPFVFSVRIGFFELYLRHKKPARVARRFVFGEAPQSTKGNAVMDNVLLHLAPVKPKLSDKANILKQYMLMHESFSRYSSRDKNKYKTEYEYNWKPPVDGYKENCPLGVPSAFMSKNREPKHTRGKRKDPALKYPELFHEASAGFVSDRLLKSTYDSRLEERPLVMWRSPKNELSIFYGPVKGSDTYNSRITDKINAASNRLVSSYNFFYFLTLTYAYNEYGTDIVEAWKIFNKQLSVTFRALRKKLKMGYVCVLEATKKGYPHAHIILASNSPVDAFHEKLTAGQEISCGSFHSFIKTHIASPVFSLQKAEGKGLVKYLGKYVSKSAESSAMKGLDAKGRFKAADRKALLSCLMPVLAQVRQYRFSIRDNVVQGTDWQEYGEDDYVLLKTLVDLGWISPEGDSALIRLLNKLTSHCQARAWIIFKKEHHVPFRHDIGWYSTAPPDLVEDFKAVGHPLGCPGCIVTWFLEKLQGLPQARDTIPYLA